MDAREQRGLEIAATVKLRVKEYCQVGRNPHVLQF